MKRIFIICIVCVLLFVGCSFSVKEPEVRVTETRLQQSDVENVLPVPNTIMIYSEGKEYQQENIEKAMEFLNSTFTRDNSHVVKLEANDDTIAWMKKNSLGVELLYAEPVTIYFDEPWENIEKLYLSLGGENEKLLFRAKEDGYLSGPIYAIDDEGLEKLVPYFHVTPPKTKGKSEVIHNWETNGDYSQDKAENSNIILMVSNQSFDMPVIELTATINGEKVFKGKYDVKNQHEVAYYFGNLPKGEYEIMIESGNGVSRTESFDLKENKDSLWMYITYLKSNDKEGIINILKQNDPIKLD